MLPLDEKCILISKKIRKKYVHVHLHIYVLTSHEQFREKRIFSIDYAKKTKKNVTK
jgi:hypothetical protein